MTAHGRLPVPAPATVELLKGLAVHGRCGPGERVTPTGAAIVAALATATGSRPDMTLSRVGSGAGGKDFEDCPNILRAFLGHAVSGSETADEIFVVETNIDDSTPEDSATPWNGYWKRGRWMCSLPRSR
jgi:pyridinium-3,5-bisthiocarboxylic acid mononucleotide nickel chelatase